MLQMRSRSRRDVVGWRWVIESSRTLRRELVRETDTIVVVRSLAKFHHVTWPALCRQRHLPSSMLATSWCTIAIITNYLEKLLLLVTDPSIMV